MGNWPQFPLGSFVDSERSISYGIVQPGEPQEHGVPIVRVNNFKEGCIDIRDALTIDPEIETKYQRSRLQGGELLLTLVGTMGLCAIVPNELRGWNVARAVGVVPLKENVDKRWLNFVLRSQPSQDFIQTHANTTVQATFNLRDLARLPIPMPPDNVRLPASALLSALDDKIDLNRRMNETLESMARAIFKDWFVDFGPTRAKVEGRAPYLAPELWDLFPDALDDEDKPVGWTTRPVSDLFEFNPRESVKKGTKTPYLDMAALPTVGPVPNAPTKREYKSGSKFRDGDTLFARITPCLENGKTAYVFNLGKEAIGAGSTEFIVIRSRSPLPQPASYLLARDLGFRAHAERSMTGTSGRQRANAQVLSQYEITAPTEGCFWNALGGLVEPMMNRVIANALESRTLTQTRDLLLPRLMSGEVRLADAERAVEAVA